MADEHRYEVVYSGKVRKSLKKLPAKVQEKFFVLATCRDRPRVLELAELRQAGKELQPLPPRVSLGGLLVV